MPGTGQIASTDTFDKWAKEVFPFGDQYWLGFTRYTASMDLLDSSPELPPMVKMHEGKYIVVPFVTDQGANDAVPASELGGLAASSAEKTSRAVFNAAIHNSAISITGLEMHTATGGDLSVVDRLQFLMQQRPLQWRREFNRHINSDGSGLLANVTSSTGNTLTVDSNKYLIPGREFVIRNKTNGNLSGSGQTAGLALVVLTQNTNGTTLTVGREDGAGVSLSGLATTDGVYPYDTQGKCINGFGAICSTVNPSNWGNPNALFGGVDRSVVTQWQANQLDGQLGLGSNQPLDYWAHVQTHIDAIESRAWQFLNAKTIPDAAGNDFSVRWYGFTGRKNFRIMQNTLSRDSRIAGEQRTLKGGYKAIEVEGLVFVVEDDAVASEIKMVHFPSVRRYDIRAPYWDDTTGSIWRVIPATDGRDSYAYRARMMYIGQMLVTQAITHGRIYNLNVN